ncbi:fibronectin type III domain-containing protein, partial [Clostridium sp. LS]
SVGDAGDVSSPSNTITITVSDGNDIEKPSVPGTPVSSGVTTNSISLTWDVSTDNVGVMGYKILRNNVVVGTTTSAASFTDTGLTPNTEYTYTIAAYDAAGNTSDNSAALIVKTMPTQVTSSFTNHDFETGDLTGWTIKSGDAFSSKDVTSDINWGWGGPFNQQGTYHLWSYKDGGDGQVGEMWTAKNFIIGGDGKIDLLVGGGNDINNLYVALVRNSDG